MKQPSQSQREAINHKDGPALLIAGPGSGKTFTIVQRIINLIEKENIPPNQILVLTFSKAAASQMHDRFKVESGNLDVHFGTFHSLAYFILKKSFSFKENNLIFDFEKRRMLSQILKNHGLDELCSTENLQFSIDSISKQKNSSNYNQISISLGTDDISNNILQSVLDEYFEFLKEKGKLDFDDMILRCIELLKNNNQILIQYQNQFKYILVDEFQDINIPQYDLVKLISYPDNNLMCVGDDDQAIYGFRGSTPGIMNIFDKDYPGNKHIYLTENYRSGENIVKLAENIISDNKIRFSKSYIPVNPSGKIYSVICETHISQNEYILSFLNGLSKEELADTAILVRTNRDVSVYSKLLSQNRIRINQSQPKNISIKDSFIFDDIRAYLKFIYEGQRRSDFLLIMNKPERYIQRAAVFNENVSLETLKQYYAQNKDMLQSLDSFFRLIHLAGKMDTFYALNIIRKNLGYEKYIRAVSKSEEEYEQNMNILIKVTDLFKNYSKTVSVEEYINSTKLDKSSDSSSNSNSNTNPDEEGSLQYGVKVMTMHTSKGLEFENVIIPDANEGILPEKGVTGNELEESRRLFFVAVTRAKKCLCILATKERNRDISRFIKNKIKFENYSSSTISSNSLLSRNSSKASQTFSYSSSSSI